MTFYNFDGYKTQKMNDIMRDILKRHTILVKRRVLDYCSSNWICIFFYYILKIGNIKNSNLSQFGTFFSMLATGFDPATFSPSGKRLTTVPASILFFPKILKTNLVSYLYLFGWRNQVLPSLWVSFVFEFVLQPRHRWRTYQKPLLFGQVKVQFLGWSIINFIFF